MKKKQKRIYATLTSVIAASGEARNFLKKKNELIYIRKSEIWMQYVMQSTPAI